MVLEDLQVGDRVGQGTAEPRLDGGWRKKVQLFAMGLREAQFPFSSASATVRLSVIDIVSSLTAGLSWYPAAILGK